MHAKPDLRVVFQWKIAGSGSVIADVIIAWALLFAFALQVGCGPGPASVATEQDNSSSSIKSRLGRFASLSPNLSLSEEWQVHSSAEHPYEVAIPRSENFCESECILFDIGGSFDVSPRKAGVPAETIVSAMQNFLAVDGELLYSETTETKNAKTFVFGYSVGDGYYQLAKVVVTEKFLYSITGTRFTKTLSGLTNDPRRTNDARHAMDSADCPVCWCHDFGGADHRGLPLNS